MKLSAISFGSNNKAINVQQKQNFKGIICIKPDKYSTPSFFTLIEIGAAHKVCPMLIME